MAGEASGDMHGANLMAALKELDPEINICGIGGKEMQAQGLEMLYDASKLAVVGIFEVLSHFKYIKEAMNTLVERMKKDPPNLLVLIDYPDFNFILGKKAKKLGIDVFYYISPQVWAWRSGRVKTISKFVKRMAVILPFEKQFYDTRGVAVDYVGHPLMDEVTTSMSTDAFYAKHDIHPEQTVVGLLPGSRKKEISVMLPTFLAAAEKLGRELIDPVFLLPLASTLTREDLEQNGLADCDLDVRVLAENRFDVMSACQAVMAASGTVTLELAILNVPMVISYKVSPITYALGRKLIKVDYAALVNLVADKEVVPELLQFDAEPGKIAQTVKGLLVDLKRRDTMMAELAEVRHRLGGGGASKRTAQLILQTLEQ